MQPLKANGKSKAHLQENQACIKSIGPMSNQTKGPGDRLFDNLTTMDELLLILKHQYSKRTIYSWVRQGMPHQKIKGKLWFPKDEIFLWLKRSS